MEWTKYVLSWMLGGCLLILFGRKGEGRNKWIFGLGFGGSLTAMELTVEYVLGKALWVMAASLMKGAAVFSAIVLLGYGMEWLGSRRRTGDEPEPVHPVRQWMEEYQESFAQLSRSFCMAPQTVTGMDRGEMILQNRLAENRVAAAGQIREMGRILEGAMERIYGTKENAELEAEIGKRLRLMGVQLSQVFFYGPGGRRRQIYITMKTRRKICVPVKKIASVLSELTGCEMMPARDSRSFVSQERITVLFVEGTAYNVLYGVKKATKQGEAVSGDSFSVFWLPEGRFFAGVSDGMGSGVQACSQSETVLDLLEQFLDAGFSKETAVRMINSSIVLQPDARVFSTVDLAAVDLYTGVCEFLKIGAAASFIRREHGVECIRGAGLPAGVSGELLLEPYRLRLYDGNLVFLVTDGVISALPEGREEAVLKDLIWRLPPGTPQEMAQNLMEQVQAYGGAADDMTILVTGLWRR
ncbi:MAG: SpoIIE family protein phosphatase [Eubacteriales bacterium]|nr:SpoIIE family protein phosphatase [Eubacteriales bacterium]